MVTETETKKQETYIGLTENEFKTIFNLRKSSFKLEHKRTTTTLSDHIWKLKKKNTEIKNVMPYAPGEKICKLCLQKKMSILISKPSLKKGLTFSDTVCTENSFFSTTSKNNTHLLQVNNNSGNTVPNNNSVV